MKAVKISALILVAGLATGCTDNNKDALGISDLQSQINGLKTQISSAASDASTAQSAAADAARKAASAEAAANRAAKYAQDTNSKLDRMFKKSMMK